EDRGGRGRARALAAQRAPRLGDRAPVPVRAHPAPARRGGGARRLTARRARRMEPGSPAERWARVRESLGAALELDGAARDEFVAELRSADPELGDELARWLALAPRAADFLDAPAAPLAWDRPARLALGPDARVGAYRVRAVLGAGSSGVVL